MRGAAVGLVRRRDDPAKPGAWMSDVAGLVLEDTTIVYAYCTADGLRDHAADVEKFALAMRDAMHQEAVSVEVNNALYIF